MIYYWAALSPPAFTWMLEFFCMIMMYNEIQPWIDDYQVFVWVLVGLHHSFVILRTWILKVFNKNTISALVCLSRLDYFLMVCHHLIMSDFSFRRHTETFSPFLQQISYWKDSLEMCSLHPQTQQPAKTVLCLPWLLFNTTVSELIVSLSCLEPHTSCPDKTDPQIDNRTDLFLALISWHLQPGFWEDFISSVSAWNHQIWS